MKTYPVYLLFAALLAISCENEIPFNLKENPPKLVMNALIDAESRDNFLYLSLTGQTQTSPVTDATVEIRINGQLCETVHAEPESSTNPFSNRYVITSAFSPGDMVRVDATTPDGSYHAWAEETVPHPIHAIEKVDTMSRYSSRYGYTQRQLQYKITFADHPNEPNFYRLVLETKTTLQQRAQNGGDTTAIYRYYSLINYEDVVLADGHPSTTEDRDNGIFDIVENKYSVFDDSRFADASYTMTVYNHPFHGYDYYNPDSVFHVKTDVTVRLLSITKDEYYYLKALSTIDSDSYDDNINEPVRLPGNVNGGLGIVGFSTERRYKIDICDEDIFSGTD